MSLARCISETIHNERVKHIRVVYTRKMQERKMFMEDLKECRKERDKASLATITEMCGPRWYQALSAQQRRALDSLHLCIYQDLLEDRPNRSAKVVNILGITPRPKAMVLMDCIYQARDDPKVLFAELYFTIYKFPFHGKRASYSLNARLILSSIHYLGLNEMIAFLREKFRPEKKEELPKPERKRNSCPRKVSPYLETMVVPLYLPSELKRWKPIPLPNLDDLDAEPYEEPPIIPTKPPPPPPVPPPKNRLTRSYCDKNAGIITIHPYSSITGLANKSRPTHKLLKGSKRSLQKEVIKKTYGLGLAKARMENRKRRLRTPTLYRGAAFQINGVYQVNGKSVYVLGNVCVLPPQGIMIHGGFKAIDNMNVNIHCGYREMAQALDAASCHCLEKYQDTVIEYIKTSKCYCNHHYDFRFEETFPSEGLPYFEKPKKNAPHCFNYNSIFDSDAKVVQVEKEFKRIWETDSTLRVNDSSEKKDKKKKKKKSSTTCLGQDPRPEDYLKCALRLIVHTNIAARLPDVHLTPELMEWMRRRLYGPYSRLEKSRILLKSAHYWSTIKYLEAKGFGHLSIRREPTHSRRMTWAEKPKIHNNFLQYSRDYRLELFKAQAYLNNLFWSTMFHAQFPDKHFREVFFSYLVPRVEDFHTTNPYSPFEVAQKSTNIRNKRYYCPPAGLEID